MCKHLFILLIAFLSSCHKDQVLFYPDLDNSEVNSKLFTPVLPQSNVYRVDVSNTNFISLEKDSALILLPPNSIIDDKNQFATSQIELEFKSVDKISPYLLVTPSTLMNNTIFKSQKLFYIKFSQNNKPLYLIKPLTIYLSENSQNKTGTFRLISNNPAINTNDWEYATTIDPILSIGEYKINLNNKPTNINGYKLTIENDKTWYSISQITEEETLDDIDICITSDQIKNPKSFVSYFVSSENNVVIKIGESIDGRWESCITNYRIPQNLTGKCIVISENGSGSYIFGMTNVILNKNIQVNINVSEISKDKMREVLFSL